MTNNSEDQFITEKKIPYTLVWGLKIYASDLEDIEELKKRLCGKYPFLPPAGEAQFEALFSDDKVKEYKNELKNTPYGYTYLKA